MRGLPWIFGGGALAYAIVRSRSKTSIVTHVTSNSLPGEWVWPVARWNGRVPVISDGFGSPRPGGLRHGGADIMFARQSADPFKPGTPNGAAHHVMPDGTQALAASDGVIWSAKQSPRGYAVVIDHAPRKVSTFYTHLEKLLVAPTANAKSNEHVRAGQPIGIIGADPQDAEHLKHLHFEIWLGGSPKDAIDPAPLLHTWEVVAATTILARNAGLVYRPLGDSGAPYPEWVRALKGEAGVYVIREIASHEIVYVGSSAGSLYNTLTRHFQRWRRYKGFWRGQYAEGHDPGLTYDRDSVEVAIRLTSPAASLEEEMRLIARLKPRDNLIGQVEVEEAVPF